MTVSPYLVSDMLAAHTVPACKEVATNRPSADCRRLALECFAGAPAMTRHLWRRDEFRQALIYKYSPLYFFERHFPLYARKLMLSEVAGLGKYFAAFILHFDRAP